MTAIFKCLYTNSYEKKRKKTRYFLNILKILVQTRPIRLHTYSLKILISKRSESRKMGKS